MISTIILVLSLLVAVGWGLSTRSNMTKRNGSYEEFNAAWLTMPILIAVSGLLIALFQPYSVSRVDAGNVGIKVKLTGDERGVSSYEYKTGWVTYNDWTENLYEFPTFQQHVEYDTIQVITKGGFSASITPSFNYAVIPGAVGDMFQNLRKPIIEVEQGWLKNAIYSSVNDVANKWPVDSIFNNRELFESSIITECNKRVAKWFVVSQLRSNIVPPPSLQAAIIEKTKSIQLAQAEVQKALVAEAQGKVKTATAKADSVQAVITASGNARAAVIQAEGDAEAMKLKQRELSNLYIDYIRASNWDGKLPSTVLGSGSGALFNLK